MTSMPAETANPRSSERMSRAEMQSRIDAVVEQIAASCRNVLFLPPDGTRSNSGAGEITAELFERLKDAVHIDIMPTLGTHVPMTTAELRRMFGPDIPLQRFKVHDWRANCRTVGHIPESMYSDWAEGRAAFPTEISVDNILFDDYDLIVSIGQVVPHEVAGMANYTKNLCVGAGGPDIINKSHFLGAIVGMERIMGRIDTPVRQLYDHAVSHFLGDLPVLYILSVVGASSSGPELHGLYIGRDAATFRQAARHSQRANIVLQQAPLDKVVVYLPPDEFKSTWLGNKAIYRTRMAMADDGELIILAPGLKAFGEDKRVDRLIRQYGYRGTDAVLQAVEQDAELQANLGAAAHLIHGSSDGRFRITYCPGDGMTADALRRVGYQARELSDALRQYDPDSLREGFNSMQDGERVYFVRNPALGLWALEEQFDEFES